jgi:hypothetical protein
MSGFYSEIISASGAYKAFIDGEWRESTSGKTVSISNPTTEATAFTVQGKDALFVFIYVCVSCALGNTIGFDVAEVPKWLSSRERRVLVSACNMKRRRCLFARSIGRVHAVAASPFFCRGRILRRVFSLPSPAFRVTKSTALV